MEYRIAFTPFRVDLQGLDGLWCQFWVSRRSTHEGLST